MMRTAVVVLLCSTSVGALLADLFGIAEMSTFFWFVTVPGLALLTGLGIRYSSSDFGRMMRVGAVGGLVGTIGYDVFRIPFALAGQRIFAPIFSYGLLIDGGPMSSPTSDLFGWLFHVSNGITFGIAFAVVMARRHWRWGVGYGLFLEAVAFLSPFTEIYGLTGRYGSIAIAFAAHVAYGFPLGWMVWRLDSTDSFLRSSLVKPVLVSVGTVVLGLVLWHRPWSVPEPIAVAQIISADSNGAAVTVVDTERFQPEWMLIDSGECVIVFNRSENQFDVDDVLIGPTQSTDWCFEVEGVTRARLNENPYAGGFVYVR
jgi:hypothetical protein